MKQFVTLILTSLSIYTFGQWQSNSTDIYYNSGNVGIGTTSPTSELHVIGRLQTTDRINARQYIAVDKNSSYRVAINGQSDGYIAGRNDLVQDKFLISSNGSSYFNGGKVGIGTKSPSADLHVVGNLATTDRINAREYIAVDRNSSYRVAMNGQTDGYIAGRNDAVEQKFLIHSNGNSYFNGGNLLIGKTSQANSAYKLDVAGPIRANEIVVNTTGADYVFEADYPLKTLDETKAFIRENGHLPGIPSAEDMQENGMSVGELNTKLLEKVEELTLYLIQQDEKLQEQQKMILELQRRMN